MDIDDFPFNFKKGSRAVFTGDFAVAGDVHLGFEEEINLNGYNIWEKTDEITKKLLSLRAKKLILLGDIRKRYTYIMPKEGGVLIKFFSVLANAFEEVIITKGNHDGGLEKITSRFNNVTLESEFVYNGIGFMHGHALPSKKLAESVDTVCISHLHPFVVMRDSNGISYRKDCFFFLDIKLPVKTYHNSRLRSGIVIPKFNQYIGGSAEFESRALMRYSKVRAKMTTDLEIL
jgi:hypothetical protein